MAVHEMGAALLKIEELELGEDEAEKLEEKIKKVASFYGNAGIPPKVVAWVELGAVCTMVYGTRIKAYNNRMKKERMNRPVEVLPKQAMKPAVPVNGKVNGKAAPEQPAGMSPSQIFGYQGVFEPTE